MRHILTFTERETLADILAAELDRIAEEADKMPDSDLESLIFRKRTIKDIALALGLRMSK